MTVRNRRVRGDVEHGLVFKSLEQRITKVIEKQTFDQFVHRATAAAVGQRNVSVREFVLTPARAFDALEEWRRGKSARHVNQQREQSAQRSSKTVRNCSTRRRRPPTRPCTVRSASQGYRPSQTPCPPTASSRPSVSRHTGTPSDPQRADPAH